MGSVVLDSGREDRNDFLTLGPEGFSVSVLEVGNAGESLPFVGLGQQANGSVCLAYLVECLQRK